MAEVRIRVEMTIPQAASALLALDHRPAVANEHGPEIARDCAEVAQAIREAMQNLDSYTRR